MISRGSAILTDGPTVGTSMYVSTEYFINDANEIELKNPILVTLSESSNYSGYYTTLSSSNSKYFYYNDGSLALFYIRSMENGNVIEYSPIMYYRRDITSNTSYKYYYSKEMVPGTLELVSPVLYNGEDKRTLVGSYVKMENYDSDAFIIMKASKNEILGYHQISNVCYN